MFKRPFFLWFSFKRWPTKTGSCIYYYRVYLGSHWTPFIWLYFRDKNRRGLKKELKLLECRINHKASYYIEHPEDEYTRGVINGMLFVQSLLLKRTPIYLESKLEKEDL